MSRIRTVGTVLGFLGSIATGAAISDGISRYNIDKQTEATRAWVSSIGVPEEIIGQIDEGADSFVKERRTWYEPSSVDAARRGYAWRKNLDQVITALTAERTYKQGVLEATKACKSAFRHFD